MFNKSRYSTETLGIFLLLASSFVQGSSGIWVKLTGVGLQVFPNILLRSFLAILLCLIVLVVTKTKLKKLSKNQQKSALLMALSFVVANTFYTFSILNTKVALTTFSFYSGSFISSLVLGCILLKEKLSITKVIALCFALLGVYSFVSKNGSISLDIGIVYGVVSGLVIPITNMYRKTLAHQINFVLILVFPYIGSFIASLLLALVFKQNINVLFTGVSPVAYFGAFMYALVLVFGNIFVVFGMKKVELYLGTLALSTNIIFSAVYSYFLLGETLTINEIIGGLLIVLAVSLPSIRNVIKNKNKSLYEKVKYKLTFNKPQPVPVPTEF